MKENEATITMDMIVSCFKRKTDAKKMREIKEAVISAMTPPEEIFLQDSGAIESQIEALIKADRKLEKESQLEYKNGKYSLRRNKRPIPRQRDAASGRSKVQGCCRRMCRDVGTSFQRV